MDNIERLKAMAQRAVDSRREWLISASTTVLNRPESGFREVETSRLVSDRFSELRIPHQKGIAITGLKGRLEGTYPGPTVAILCELDALPAPGHPHADPDTGVAHACGHHTQVGVLLGAAVALTNSDVLCELSGNIVLMAVPAEEFVNIEDRWNLYQEGKIGLFSGKQEFIRLGAFDDSDIAIMSHTFASSSDGKFALGGTSNAHVGKYVRFEGKASHAGSAPHYGVNALQAAMVGLNALNSQRETLREQDVIRMHGILIAGGTSVNAVPDDVRYEGRVRARTFEAIQETSEKMDRCLRAGALALGAAVRIVTVPGYMPIINNPLLMETFKQNAIQLVRENGVVHYSDVRNEGGSTDMGDLSQIIPSIHPYTGGATGTGHGNDYLIMDYDQAVIKPAKAIAMSVIDLLSEGAAGATEIITNNSPPMTKETYLAFQQGRLTDHLYDCRTGI
ncbi:MAG: amidohydrolase [SAR202 cluster bacterium]|nr:amidohydrolase [SAR202 cluster bacterium]